MSRKSAHQHKLEMQGLREKEAHSADEIMKMKKDESLGLKVAEVPHSLAMLCLLPPSQSMTISSVLYYIYICIHSVYYICMMLK